MVDTSRLRLIKGGKEDVEDSFVLVRPHKKITRMLDYAKNEYRFVKNSLNGRHYCRGFRFSGRDNGKLQGYRFYIGGILFDVPLRVVEKLPADYLQVYLPSIDDIYVRLSSWVDKETGQSLWVSCLERYEVNGRIVESYEIKSVEQLKYILGVYRERGTPDIDFFKRLESVEQVNKSTSPNVEQVNKSTSPVTSPKAEQVNKSTSPVTCSLASSLPLLDNLKLLPQILDLLQQVNAKLDGLSVEQASEVKEVVNTIKETVHYVEEDLRFKSEIDLSHPQVHAFLYRLLTRIDELRGRGYSERKSFKEVKYEMDIEGSELNVLKKEFLKYGNNRKTDVSEHNIRDYYKNRYCIVNGKVVRRPDADKR